MRRKSTVPKTGAKSYSRHSSRSGLSQTEARGSTAQVMRSSSRQKPILKQDLKVSTNTFKVSLRTKDMASKLKPRRSWSSISHACTYLMKRAAIRSASTFMAMLKI